MIVKNQVVVVEKMIHNLDQIRNQGQIQKLQKVNENLQLNILINCITKFV